MQVVIALLAYFAVGIIMGVFHTIRGARFEEYEVDEHALIGDSIALIFLWPMALSAFIVCHGFELVHSGITYCFRSILEYSKRKESKFTHQGGHMKVRKPKESIQAGLKIVSDSVKGE